MSLFKPAYLLLLLIKKRKKYICAHLLRQSSAAQFKVCSATSGRTNLIWMLMSHSFSAKLWGNGTFVWCVNLDGENTPPTRMAHCHAKLCLAYIVLKNAIISNCTKLPTAAPAGPWLAGAPRRGSGDARARICHLQVILLTRQEARWPFPNYVYVSRRRCLRQAIQLSQQSGDSQGERWPRPACCAV